MSHAVSRAGILGEVHAPPFDPLTIPWAMFGEARRETGLSSGANTPITDQSGNGNHLTSATAGLRPAWTTGVSGIGGQPVYRFDGTSQIVAATFTLAQPTWLWMVRRVRAISTVNDDINDGSSLNKMVAQTNGPNGDRAYAGAFLTSAGLDWSVFHAVAYLFSGASSECRFDDLVTASGNVGAANGGGLTVGGGATGGNLSQIDVAAVGVLARAPTTLERTALAGYARSTFGTP